MSAGGDTPPWPAESIWQQVMALGLPSMAAFSVEILPEIDSTNTELMRRARKGAIEPTLLVAESQTAGRGRLGRDWQSSVGDSLTFSLGLSLNPRKWEGLSLAVGTSIALSLANLSKVQKLGSDELQLKWPNDIWWQSRKLAGILIETSQIANQSVHLSTRERYAVVGVGMNIKPRGFTSELRTPPACVQELISTASAQMILESLFLPLLMDLMEFERAGFAAFAARFSTLDALKGKEVFLSSGQSGLAQGVDGEGSLLVHTQRGVQKVSSMEISVRPLPSSPTPNA